MKLEILLSVMNLKNKDLDKMNINSKCTVINQCGKNDNSTYKNFTIYSYNELGFSNNRNRGLEKVKEDIILLSDEGIIYNDKYEGIILDEFRNNPKADIIIFNIKNSSKRINRNKKLHIYDSINYASYQIAFRRKSIIDKKIVFNNLFGIGSLYGIGEDTLFLRDSVKNKLKVYLSCKYIGTTTVNSSLSYNEKFFFDKGALYTAISKRFKKIRMFIYLLKNKNLLKNTSFLDAYKNMKNGSIDYLERIYER